MTQEKKVTGSSNTKITRKTCFRAGPIFVFLGVGSRRPGTQKWTPKTRNDLNMHGNNVFMGLLWFYRALVGLLGPVFGLQVTISTGGGDPEIRAIFKNTPELSPKTLELSPLLRSQARYGGETSCIRVLKRSNTAFSRKRVRRKLMAN
jgi:hypothetical protein